ncbi:MAG TPA: hypothetical protein VFR15_16715 [Chloroflexia bacterium]|nr:hypothetical protein [Chloroflexia bacterium]
MRDNPHSESDVPGWAKMLINAVYVLCAVVGLVVGLYGLYILVASMIIVEGFDLIGLLFGLPFTGAGFGLFALALNLLLGTWYRDARYKPRTWALALLGLVASSAIALFVFTSFRGI